MLLQDLMRNQYCSKGTNRLHNPAVKSLVEEMLGELDVSGELQLNKIQLDTMAGEAGLLLAGGFILRDFPAQVHQKKRQ